MDIISRCDSQLVSLDWPGRNVFPESQIYAAAKGNHRRWISLLCCHIKKNRVITVVYSHFDIMKYKWFAIVNHFKMSEVNMTFLRYIFEIFEIDTICKLNQFKYLEPALCYDLQKWSHAPYLFKCNLSLYYKGPLRDIKETFWNKTIKSSYSEDTIKSALWHEYNHSYLTYFLNSIVKVRWVLLVLYIFFMCTKKFQSGKFHIFSQFKRNTY